MNIFDDIFYTGDLARKIMKPFEINMFFHIRENYYDPTTGRTVYNSTDLSIKCTPFLDLTYNDDDKFTECDGVIYAEAKQFEPLGVEEYEKCFIVNGNVKYEIKEVKKIYSGEKLVALKFGVVHA